MFAGATRTHVELLIATDEPHERSVVSVFQSHSNLLHTKSQRLVYFNLNRARAAVVDDFVGFLGLRNYNQTVLWPRAPCVQTHLTRAKLWNVFVHPMIEIVCLGFFAG